MRNKIDISRPQREVSQTQELLFDIGNDWKKHWWGMPEFTQFDCAPERRITMNFRMLQDVKDFAERIGMRITDKTDSLWFPQQERLNGQYVYSGPKCDSKYPVCIPSKGRRDCAKTHKALDRLGVSYRFFVEQTEYEQYCAVFGESKVVKLPFHDLGQGSIPARNFIWDWAQEREHKRHWVVDDNIDGFARLNNNRRIHIHGGGIFRLMEDFVDRYENVAIAGPHDRKFVPDRDANLTPFLLNSRVYSCILIDTSIPYRWRGKYNEDTDLSLRALKDGYCTVLFRSLLMRKYETVGAKGRILKGGNTDHVYNTGDHRLAFAKSLEEQHPDCVKVVWKFNRWHHQVDYSRFKDNKLVLRTGVTPTVGPNNYGMTLTYRDELAHTPPVSHDTGGM